MRVTARRLGKASTIFEPLVNGRVRFYVAMLRGRPGCAAMPRIWRPPGSKKYCSHEVRGHLFEGCTHTIMMARFTIMTVVVTYLLARRYRSKEPESQAGPPSSFPSRGRKMPR